MAHMSTNGSYMERSGKACGFRVGLKTQPQGPKYFVISFEVHLRYHIYIYTRIELYKEYGTIIKP